MLKNILDKAGRVSHLASSVHVSSLEAPLLAPVSTMLQHTLEAILEAPVEESTWGLHSRCVKVVLACVTL